MWIFGPLGIFGAGLAIYLLFIRSKLACPFCGAAAEFHFGKRAGLTCARCGDMYVDGAWASRITRGRDPELENSDANGEE
jgi:hypothetical protein